MITVFVILAIFFFLMMTTGIIFLRKNITWQNVNGTFKYRNSQPNSKKKGILTKHRGYGIQKMKGKTGYLNIKYQIPEFYQKLRSGDKKAIRFSILVLGAAGFILSTFLAIGTALLQDGDSGGWYFIGGVSVFILLVIILHVRAIRKRMKI